MSPEDDGKADEYVNEDEEKDMEDGDEKGTVNPRDGDDDIGAECLCLLEEEGLETS